MNSNSEKALKICFLADKHELYDDRIYWKMAVPLVKRGYQVVYLLIGDSNDRGMTKEGVEFVVFKVKTFSNNRYINFILKRLNPNNNYKKLYLEAKKQHSDIYHFHDFWLNRIGGKLKRLKQKPVVFYDSHEPYAEDYVSLSTERGLLKIVVVLFSKWVDYWEKKKSKKYDLVISTEEIVRNAFRKAIGTEKAEVIYNYTDNQDEYRDLKNSDKKYDFIYTGSITELRGVISLLKASSLVKKEFTNFKLLFIGKYTPVGLKERMEDIIEKEGLKDNVILHDYVRYDKMENYYNLSKVGVLIPLPEKSFKIKMFIKIFEYMTFGLPIIGSDFGHIKEFIEKDNCGLLVDPENINGIVEAMIKMLSDTNLYETFSRNGRSAAVLKYNWGSEFEKLLEYYKVALEKRKLELNE